MVRLEEKDYEILSEKINEFEEMFSEVDTKMYEAERKIKEMDEQMIKRINEITTLRDRLTIVERELPEITKSPKAWGDDGGSETSTIITAAGKIGYAEKAEEKEEKEEKYFVEHLFYRDDGSLAAVDLTENEEVAAINKAEELFVKYGKFVAKEAGTSISFEKWLEVCEYKILKDAVVRASEIVCDYMHSPECKCEFVSEGAPRLETIVDGIQKALDKAIIQPCNSLIEIKLSKEK